MKTTRYHKKCFDQIEGIAANNKELTAEVEYCASDSKPPIMKRWCKNPRTRNWSSSSVIKSRKEQVSSHFITTTIDKCCCVVGSNSCSAGLEAEVVRLQEENSRVVVECDRLKEDNRKLAQPVAAPGPHDQYDRGAER